MKKLFTVVLVVAGGVLIWFLFALWTGIYSVYSYPPSKERPEGVTYIVSRADREPMFNSPDYVPPKPKQEGQRSSIGFDKAKTPVKPIEQRIIVTLPYVEWAYKKSREPAEE